MFSRLEESLVRRPGTMVQGMNDARQAAVAVVVRPNLDIIFIRRADNERDPWSGHIALPGGRVDPGDASPEAAARRELFEEVGIELGDAPLVGRMNQVASPSLAPRIVVTPFVFRVANDPRTALQTSEVAAVHWFGLDRLLAGEGRGRFHYEYRGHSMMLPCVELDGERIWGMTLRVVDELIERLRTGDGDLPVE